VATATVARHSIIIDCDPGQDDAVALLLALACPDEIELLAVTAVAGNVPLALTSRNARQLVELSGRTDVPVYAGCAGPLFRRLETAEYVHGSTGLNGVELPEPSVPLRDEHAVDAIVDIVRGRPAGAVTLCPIGPLTNVALAFAKAPDIVPRLRGVVLMGGAIGLGNVTPAAEFNIYVDPHAAAAVFGSGAPLTMLGLDVTHKALVTPERLERFGALGTPAGAACRGMLDFYNRFDRARYGFAGAPLHDPCVIAYLLRPDLFTGKDCRVEVETEGGSAGRTNVHWWPREPQVPNAHVVEDLDAEAFFALLHDRIGRLGGGG
jgi:purine nucleosidase